MKTREVQASQRQSMGELRVMHRAVIAVLVVSAASSAFLRTHPTWTALPVLSGPLGSIDFGAMCTAPFLIPMALIFFTRREAWDGLAGWAIVFWILTGWIEPLSDLD